MDLRLDEIKMKVLFLFLLICFIDLNTVLCEDIVVGVQIVSTALISYVTTKDNSSQ